MSDGPVENRLMMRRRLIAELKQDARKAEGGSMGKRYKMCEHCGTEGCEAEHETEEIAGNPEPVAEEKEISPEDLAGLLGE